MKKKTRWYFIKVLSYYRSEWTDIPDDDANFKLLLNEELKKIISTCMKRGVNIPNAAKEVEIFFDLLGSKTEPKVIADSNRIDEIKSKFPESDRNSDD